MQGFSGVWYSGGVGLEHVSALIRQEGRDQFRPGACSIYPERERVMAAPWEGSQCQHPWLDWAGWLYKTSKSPALLSSSTLALCRSCTETNPSLMCLPSFPRVCAMWISLTLLTCLSSSFHNSSRWVWLTAHRPYTPSVGSSFQQISPNCLNFTGRQRENE